MAPARNTKAYLFLAFLATTSAFTVSYVPHAKGRKLFGGYRIVPKVCQPTNPSRSKSGEPAICMFNYECTRRNGEVVGACMDGFLFGACCQLPSKQSSGEIFDKVPNAETLLSIHEIDHVPDIPILLNPDGTPMGMDMPGSQSFGTKNRPSDADDSKIKISTSDPQTPTSHYTDSTSNSAKPQIPSQADLTDLESDFPALLNQQSILDDLRLPGLLTHSDSNNDIQNHQDSSSVNPVTTFLNPNQILQIADPVDQLPALFSQGLGQNNHSSAETILFNENGSLVDESNNPDELFRPVTIDGTKPGTGSSVAANNGPSSSENEPETTSSGHEPARVTQKVTSTTGGTETSGLDVVESTSTQRAPTTSHRIHPVTQKTKLSTLAERISSITESVAAIAGAESHAASSKSPAGYSVSSNEIPTDRNTNVFATLNGESTTPMSPDDKDTMVELVRVPTITYDSQSGNKKDDVLDNEEIAIHHIITILNDTSGPTSEPQPLPEPAPHPDPLDPTSGIHTWISVDGTSLRPSTTRQPETTTVSFPYTFYTPSQPPSVYYDYGSASTRLTVPPTILSHHTFPSRPSTQGAYPSSLSYSNRPSTNPPAPTVIVLGPLGADYTTKTTQKTPTWRPATTLKPNITRKPVVSTTITHNTVISTTNEDTNDKHVVSTSYISVNLQDGTSAKPGVGENDTPGTLGPVNTETTHREEMVTRPEATIYQEIETKKPPTTVPDSLSTWSGKPSFHLKPSTIRPINATTFGWPQDDPIEFHPVVFRDPVVVAASTASISTTTVSPEEETTAPDDLSNFPPVRNPNLNMSVPASQQEKPTIVETFNHTFYPGTELINENEIPTPAFIEDDILTNKVDGFVDKIVQSLQGNFQDLKDVVYNKKNTSNVAGTTTTRRPVAASTTRKPLRRPTQSPSQVTGKPSQATTRRPATTKRPPVRVSTTTRRPAGPVKVTTTRPKPTSQVATTRKPRPTRRPTVVTTETPQTVVVLSDDPTEATNTATSFKPKPTPDFRKECGVRPLMKTGRIVGGKGAKFGEWPWQVLVREATWLGLFTKNKCGGVLITNKYVVTAAHCQPGFLASLVAVFGEFDISGELESKRSVSRNVRRVIVNRAYDPATFENDLALLELETPVQFDSHIVPICMPEDGADFTGRMATVTGWGRLKYNGGVPSVLQEVQVPVMENSVCQEMFQTAGHSKLILDSFLCAGYANGQKDSCEGDSGGPLMVEREDGRWELAGTVSHGIKCAAPYLPGVYMRTTFFKPWLHTITGV